MPINLLECTSAKAAHDYPELQPRMPATARESDAIEFYQVVSNVTRSGFSLYFARINGCDYQVTLVKSTRSLAGNIAI
jgi:hypothetical protein